MKYDLWYIYFKGYSLILISNSIINSSRKVLQLGEVWGRLEAAERFAAAMLVLRADTEAGLRCDQQLCCFRSPRLYLAAGTHRTGQLTSGFLWGCVSSYAWLAFVQDYHGADAVHCLWRIRGVPVRHSLRHWSVKCYSQPFQNRYTHGLVWKPKNFEIDHYHNLLNHCVSTISKLWVASASNFKWNFIRIRLN